MSFYVFRALERVFLADDERGWTPDFSGAAGFSSRDLADDIATRELGRRARRLCARRRHRSVSDQATSQGRGDRNGTVKVDVRCWIHKWR